MNNVEMNMNMNMEMKYEPPSLQKKGKSNEQNKTTKTKITNKGRDFFFLNI